MSVVRVAFMGTPEFAKYHLQHLIDDEHYQVVGVVTQPDRRAGRKMKSQASPVKSLALEHSIPVISPAKITVDEIEIIRSWNAEVSVVVAFGQLLSEKVLVLFPKGIVNVHGSLLPRWRGAAPIQRALMTGDAESGVALQLMVKKLDAGDVLGERKLTITDDIDAKILHDKLMELGADLLHIELMDYIRGNLTPIPQDESLVTYAKKIAKEEGLIDWSKSAREIFNQIRALCMSPGTYTLRQGKKLKIHSAAEVPSPGDEPGQVIEVDASSFVVSCGQNALKVHMVQPESRAKMTVTDYLKGYPMQEGEVLGE